MRHRSLLLGVGLVATASAAHAQTAPPPSDEVVVAGTRLSHTAGSAQVIRKEQLERQEYDDAAAILMQVPGVYARGEDGVGLRPNLGIRGANPDRSKKLTLMEDGILLGPAPYSAPAGYYMPLLTRMTEVRVVKGPSAIAYGPHTVGGAVDFLSRPIPTKLAGAVDLGAGEYGYAKVHAYGGYSTGKLGFLVEGVHLANTGFAELPSGADTGSSRNDWMVKAAYTIDPSARTKHRLQLKLSYADEVSNETYLGQSDADFRTNAYRRYPATALDQMRNHRKGIVVSHTMEGPDSSFTIKTSLYRQDYDRTWRKLNRLGSASAAAVLANADDPAFAGYHGVLTGRTDTGSAADTLWIGPNARRFVSQGIQSVLSTTARTGPIGHRFEAGFRLHHDEIERLHTEDAFRMIDGRLVSAGQPTLTTADNTARTYAVAMHLTDAITFRSLTLTPGARVEFIDSQNADRRTARTTDGFVGAVMPGVGAYQELVEGLGVLGGVYRGFTPPAPGSDNAKPEYSVSYEAGARYMAGTARAEVIGFYNDYSNLTDVCTLASGCVAENLDRQFDAGKARIYGLEVAVGDERRVGAFRVPLNVAYTFTRGELRNDFTSADPIYGTVKAGDELPYIPKHQLNVSAALEHRYAGVNALLGYVAPMREQAGSAPFSQSVVTDEQVWLDLGAYVSPLRWLKVYGNLRNAFGAENIVGRRPYGARANAPRWLQIGLKATY